MELSTARHYGLFFLSGGCAYWTLDAVTQLLSNYHRLWIALLTLAVPACTVGVCLFLRRRFPQHLRAVPLWMLLGVWVLGPLGIAVGMIPLGGTFLTAEHVREFLALWLWFPLATLILSTYSGSLGGVLLVTVALPACAVIRSPRLAGASNNCWRSRDAM
jgi:hypothetical protein